MAVEESIKRALFEVVKKPEIQKIISENDFYFEKAHQKYRQFNDFNISVEAIKEINENIAAMGNKFSFNTLLDYYAVGSMERDFLLIIGALVAYLDSKAANKNEYNEYEDHRVVSSPFVRQNVWVKSLLSYKLNSDVETLPDNVASSLKYIAEPEKKINIVSPVHKRLIGLHLLKKDIDINSFEDEIALFFSEINVQTANPANLMVVYTNIIYSSEIRKLWDEKKPIWKISHSSKDFKKDARASFLENQIVVVGKETGHGQGKAFVETMAVGDYFYLCFSSEVILLGIITSDAVSYSGEISGYENYLQRSYEVIKECTNGEKYSGVLKGWAPNYNSTFKKVPDGEMNIFQQELLLPYFEMSVGELMNEEIDPIPPIKPIVGEEIIFDDLNIILYGPPGTGKTYNCINYAVAIINKRDPDLIKGMPYGDVKKLYQRYADNNQIVFTTFHQAYGYEEFIEGIKPVMAQGESGEIAYVLESGIFKKICDNAKENPQQNYVLIIDEINRGNISKIFGELITLIESSKRAGNSEELHATLPYSKKDFNVPKNVYIVATMNTADRSIALMDTALRRRFTFIEVAPETSIFKKLNDNETLVVEGIDIKKMLDVMNERIEIIYDREHMIGQAYFMELLNNNTLEKLSAIFENKIIPLLQEYFYDDYEKIRIVLADTQITNREMQFIVYEKPGSKLFGENYDAEGIIEKGIYKINPEALSNQSAYLKIYDSDSVKRYSETDDEQ